MPRPRSAGSDGSDNDGDGSAENELELQKLQRQYRLLDNDKKAYLQESQDIIKRQRADIEKLEREHQELERDLQLIESPGNQTKNDRQCENLGELGRKKKECEQEIEEEHKKQQTLDAQIREMERSLQKQPSEGTGGGNAGKSRGGSGGAGADGNKHKQKRKLEDQLQLANHKFGKSLEMNKELRREIDNLRNERQRFENLYKELEKQKYALQCETSQVIDQSTQAYDQRVEAQEKMLTLNEKAEKDVQQHNAEMKELIRIIDHDRKLREFMNVKGVEREEDVQLVTWRQRKEYMEAEKKKANQTDSVESYEAAFTRIKEITQEEDITLIVNQFIEVEDQNFALFNFVNDQNNKIELLQEQIQKIKDDIRGFENEGIQLEATRQAILKQLEERQTKACRDGNMYDERNKELNKVLDQVKAGVGSLFTKIGCERTAIDDLLGVQEGVTDQNLLQHLGIIEERTNQLLLQQAYSSGHKDHDEFINRRQPTLLGEGPQPHHQTQTIPPPAVNDVFESSDESADEDDSVRPLTRDEIAARAMRSVEKRETVVMKKQSGTHFDREIHSDKSKKKDKHSSKK